MFLNSGRLGESLKLRIFEGKTTVCLAGLGFGKKIMWLSAKEKRKMVGGSLKNLRLRGKHY